MGTWILTTFSLNIFHGKSDQGCSWQNWHSRYGIDPVLPLEIIETFDFIFGASQCLVLTH